MFQGIRAESIKLSGCCCTEVRANNIHKENSVPKKEETKAIASRGNLMWQLLVFPKETYDLGTPSIGEIYVTQFTPVFWREQIRVSLVSFSYLLACVK